MANQFTIYKGVSFIWPIHWQDAAGVAVPLTGKTINFRLLKGTREFLSLTSGAAATTLGSALTIVTAANGDFLLTITDEETEVFRSASDNIWGIMKYTAAGAEHLMFKKAFTIETA